MDRRVRLACDASAPPQRRQRLRRVVRARTAPKAPPAAQTPASSTRVRTSRSVLTSARHAPTFPARQPGFRYQLDASGLASARRAPALTSMASVVGASAETPPYGIPTLSPRRRRARWRTIPPSARGLRGRRAVPPPPLTSPRCRVVERCVGAIAVLERLFDREAIEDRGARLGAGPRRRRQGTTSTERNRDG
jgi:hypothetical protein